MGQHAAVLADSVCGQWFWNVGIFWHVGNLLLEVPGNLASIGSAFVPSYALPRQVREGLGPMEPPKLAGGGRAQLTRTIISIGGRKKILSTVADHKNVHDACMSTTCCWNDTMYGSAQG